MIITLNLSLDRLKQIKNFLYIKKLTGTLDPENDPLDWLAMDVIKAAMLNELNTIMDDNDEKDKP